MKPKKRAKAHAKKAAPTKPRPAPRKTAGRKGPARPAAARAATASPKPAAGSNPLAQRMAAFSAKVLDEEEAPVAVRSFNEARAGIGTSKRLLPKTGEVTPVERLDEPAEEDAPSQDEGTKEAGPESFAGDDEHASQPRMEPMSGRLAVPRQRTEEFKVAPAAPKKGRVPKVETPEEFGPVELRQATATGGRHITRSNPENLQKAVGRIQPLAAAEEPAKKGTKPKPETFDVAQQTRSGTRSPTAPTSGPRSKDLLDWGDIEIGQQTLSGSRKIGKLKKDEP